MTHSILLQIHERQRPLELGDTPKRQEFGSTSVGNVQLDDPLDGESQVAFLGRFEADQEGEGLQELPTSKAKFLQVFLFAFRFIQPIFLFFLLLLS